MTKRLSILGSTGSIGTQSLDVVDKRGYEVVALTAHSNADIIENQIRKYKPKYAAMVDEKAAQELKMVQRDVLLPRRVMLSEQIVWKSNWKKERLSLKVAKSKFGNLP